MRLSVVVPSYGRPEILERCLEGLAAQERQPDECIVVARADDEATHRAAHESRVRPAPVVTGVPKPGLVAALNAGLDRATGDVVVFTDDDAIAHPDWLARIERTFQDEPDVGAVGGRDTVHIDGIVDTRRAEPVGRLSWFGRMVGNHHLGAGSPRDVHFLKGVNMAFRREALGPERFDSRLRGDPTEHGSELGMSFALLRRGWRIVYDPAVAVEHVLASRAGPDDRSWTKATRLRNAAHNETLALVEHLSGPRRVAMGAWALMAGTRTMPGMLQLVRGSRGVRAALRGRREGWKRARSGTGAAVLTVAHSGYGATRARQLLRDQPGQRIVTAGGGGAGALRAIAAIACHPAQVVYLVDVGLSTSIGAIVARVLGRRVVLDTGDLAYELARSVGGRGRLGLMIVAVGERTALRCAHHVVVRGRRHAEHLRGKATTFIPDVAPASDSALSPESVRAQLGLSDAFVIGLVGTLNYSERLDVSYGWDLVEALVRCPPDVQALVIGDGDGLPWLERRARELGVHDRCRFTGRIAAGNIAPYVEAMDAAISTQSADAVGEVRTTGKLPLYLSAGCPVIASDVGEARILLGPLGWTLPYQGTVDRSYPERLAALITTWSQDGRGAARRDVARKLSRTAFDPDTMRRRLGGLLADLGAA
jgi:GT2 family glycosyltransferase/glycosyltransferase involved in cell wall biosynthesis